MDLYLYCIVSMLLTIPKGTHDVHTATYYLSYIITWYKLNIFHKILEFTFQNNEIFL